MDQPEGRKEPESSLDSGTKQTAKLKDVAEGILIKFVHLNEIRFEIHYRQAGLLAGRPWDGPKRRILSLTVNNQCGITESVLELKRLADVLQIDFGDSPQLVVLSGTELRGTTAYVHSAAAAEQLGWALDFPELLAPESATSNLG